MIEELSGVLRSAGKEPVVLGNQALVLPFGCRVLGLYPAPGVNSLWRSDALDQADTASALIGEPGWVNTGGLRGWISPETETHVSDLDGFWETYEVPRQVDPGAYRVTASDDGSVTLECAMTPHFYRHGVDVPLHLRRTFSLIDAEAPAGVHGAGIAIDSVLSAAGPLPDGVRPALWNLVQVPGGGEIVVPVNRDPDPVTMFGEPGFQYADDRIRWRVETNVSSKISLRAPDCRGCMAYLSESGPAPTLLVYRFSVHDASLYSDVPGHDLTDTGQVQQVYVDDGSLGGFGELEYHTPALEPGEREELTDHGELRAYTGPVEMLREVLDETITRHLL